MRRTSSLHTFSMTFASATRAAATPSSDPPSRDTASSALGIPGIPTNAAFNNALPLFTFTGFQQLGPSASTFSAFQTAVWQLVDTVVYHAGPPRLQAGLDFRWYQLNTVCASQSYRLIRLHHHRHRSAGRHQQRQRDRKLPAGPGRYIPDRSADRARFAPATTSKSTLLQDDWRAARPPDPQHRSALHPPFPLD